MASDIDDRLALLPIDEDAWRLCDRRERPADAAYVVAYIERSGEVYEVIWMSGSPRRSRYASMERLLEKAGERLADSACPGSVRPQHIPHFPPPQA